MERIKNKNQYWLQTSNLNFFQITSRCIQENLFPSDNPFRTIYCIFFIVVYVVALWFNIGWWRNDYFFFLTNKYFILSYIDALFCGFGFSNGGIILLGIIPLLSSLNLRSDNLLKAEDKNEFLHNIKYFLISLFITFILYFSDSILLNNSDFMIIFWVLNASSILLHMLNSTRTPFFTFNISKLVELFLTFITTNFILAIYYIYPSIEFIIAFIIIHRGAVITCSIHRFLLREWDLSLFHIHAIILLCVIAKIAFDSLNNNEFVIIISFSIFFTIYHCYFLNQKVTLNACQVELNQKHLTNIKYDVSHKSFYFFSLFLTIIVSFFLYSIMNFSFQLSLSPFRLVYYWDIIHPLSSLIVTTFVFFVFPNLYKSLISLSVQSFLEKIQMNHIKIKSLHPDKNEEKYIIDVSLDGLKNTMIFINIAFFMYWSVNSLIKYIYSYDMIASYGALIFIICLSLFSDLLTMAYVNLIDLYQEIKLSGKSSIKSINKYGSDINELSDVSMIDEVKDIWNNLLTMKEKFTNTESIEKTNAESIEKTNAENLVKKIKEIYPTIPKTTNRFFYIIILEIIISFLFASFIYGFIVRFVSHVDPYLIIFISSFIIIFIFLLINTAFSHSENDSFLDDNVSSFTQKSTNITEIDSKLKVLNEKRQEMYRDEMMATLGQMSGNMAHEFNTPLQELKLIAQSTPEFIQEDEMTKEEIIERFNKIDKVVDKMAQHIEHIRILANDDPQKIEIVNLNNVIRSAFDFLQQHLHNNNIIFETNLQSNLPEIKANNSRLEQVFINLIQNARDAMSSITNKEKKIIVKSKEIAGEKPYIRIEFEDNGTGIEPNTIKRIFEPFYSTKSPGKGMGIGLSIVKQIVEDFSGKIYAQNNPEKGVKFILTFPIKLGNNTRRKS